MECQSLFSGKIRQNINLSSVELAQSIIEITSISPVVYQAPDEHNIQHEKMALTTLCMQTMMAQAPRL